MIAEDPFAEYEEIVQEDLRKGQYYEEYTDDGRQNRLGIMYSKSPEERISVKDQLLELYKHLNSENVSDFLNKLGLKDRITLGTITEILAGSKLPNNNLAQYFSHRLEAHSIIDGRSFMMLYSREAEFNESNRLKTKKFLVPIDKDFVEKDRKFYLKLSSVHKGKNCYHMPTFGMVLDEFESRKITNYHSLIPALSSVWGLSEYKTFELLPLGYSAYRESVRGNHRVTSLTEKKLSDEFPLTLKQNNQLNLILTSRADLDLNELFNKIEIQVTEKKLPPIRASQKILSYIFENQNIFKICETHGFPRTLLNKYIEGRLNPTPVNSKRLSNLIFKEFGITQKNRLLLQVYLNGNQKFYDKNLLEKDYLTGTLSNYDVISIELSQKGLSYKMYAELLNKALSEKDHLNERHIDYYLNEKNKKPRYRNYKIGITIAENAGFSNSAKEIYASDFAYGVKTNVTNLIEEVRLKTLSKNEAIKILIILAGYKNIEMSDASIGRMRHQDFLKPQQLSIIKSALSHYEFDDSSFDKAFTGKHPLKPKVVREKPKPIIREKEKKLVKPIKEDITEQKLYILLDNQASDKASDIVFEDYKKAFVISELQEPSSIQNLFTALKEATKLGYKKLNHELKGLRSENYVITGALPQPNNLKNILENFERLLKGTEYEELFNKELIRRFIYSQYPVNKEKPLKQVDRLLKEKGDASQNEFKYTKPNGVENTIDPEKYSGEEKEIAKLILKYQKVIIDKERTDFGQSLNEFKTNQSKEFLTELITLKKIGSLRAFSIEFLNRSGQELSNSNIRNIGENLSRYQKQDSFPLNVEKKWSTVSYLTTDKTLAYHTALLLEGIPVIRTPEEMLNDIMQNRTSLKWGDILREARLREGLQSGTSITQADFAKSLEFERSGRIVKGISDGSVSGWEQGYNTDETLLIQAASERIGFKGEARKNFSLLAFGVTPDGINEKTKG